MDHDDHDDPDLEPDPQEDPTSDYATSVSSLEFTSITTSRMRHSYSHGRRYQGFLQGRYGMPNDDAEQTREGIKHRLFVDYILQGKLVLAPIGTSPHKIVDLGTGVGLWAQDVAEEFPSARVIGIDLSPIQPHWNPPNCEFHVEDLEDELRPWTSIYKDADLIHTRSFLQTLRKPAELVNNIFQNLRPGGWYQAHEMLPMIYDEQGAPLAEHPMNRLYDLLDGPFTRIYGWNLRVAYRVRALLEAAGFVNIRERVVLVPIGRWHHEARMREMGLFALSTAEDFATAMLTRHETVNLTEQQAGDLSHQIVTALNDVRRHCHYKSVNYWAQRPPS